MRRRFAANHCAFCRVSALEIVDIGALCLPSQHESMGGPVAHRCLPACWEEVDLYKLPRCSQDPPNSHPVLQSQKRTALVITPASCLTGGRARAVLPLGDRATQQGP